MAANAIPNFLSHILWLGTWEQVQYPPFALILSSDTQAEILINYINSLLYREDVFLFVCCTSSGY
jgi:hypothetical protein